MRSPRRASLPRLACVAALLLASAGCDASPAPPPERAEPEATEAPPEAEALPPIEREELRIEASAIEAAALRDREAERSLQDGEGAPEVPPPDRAALLASTAERIEALFGRLEGREREGLRVERTEEALLLHGVPRSARLRLYGQASFARIRQLFEPHRSELMHLEEGPIRYYMEGNGTLSVRHEEGARARLRAWLGRLPADPEVRYLLRGVCRASARATDLGVEVVREPAPLEGAIVERVFAARIPQEGQLRMTLMTDLNEGAAEGWGRVREQVRADNSAVILTFGDRVLWWSWYAAVQPEPGRLRLHACEQACAEPTLRERAALVRAAALIEEARSAIR